MMKWELDLKLQKDSIDPKELLAVADVKAVENYILKEFKKFTFIRY